MGLSSGKCLASTRLDNKTVVITGCNTGIGKVTARELYKLGARVVMACRDTKKAEEAAEEIKTAVQAGETKDFGEVVVRKLDLASLSSVRECAKSLLETEGRIDILINNAGVMVCPYSLTEDGFEMQFGTNHLGHFLFTCLLLPRIISSAPARIITVSSMAHTIVFANVAWGSKPPAYVDSRGSIALACGMERMAGEDGDRVGISQIGATRFSNIEVAVKFGGKIDFSDLMWKERSYSAIQAYQQSKLANVLFSKELARRLGDKKVTTYSLHPGVIQTELGRHIDSVYFKGARQLASTLGYFFYKTVEQGAQTTLYCALEESIASQTGLYYSDCAVKEPSSLAKDEDLAKRLWEESAKLTGVDWDPKEFSNVK